MSKKFYNDINKIIIFDGLSCFFELLIGMSAYLVIYALVENVSRYYLIIYIAVLIISIIVKISFDILARIFNNKILESKLYYEFETPKQIEYTEFVSKLFNEEPIEAVRKDYIIYRYHNRDCGSLGIVVNQELYNDSEISRMKSTARDELHKVYKKIEYRKKWQINFIFVDQWSSDLENKLMEFSSMSKELISRRNSVLFKMDFIIYKNKIYIQPIEYGSIGKSGSYKKAVKKVLAYFDKLKSN